MSTKPKKAAKVVSTGIRYSDALKKQVVEFVEKYNSTKGRGGQSAAASKFKITPLTIATWLKAAGAKTGGAKVAKKAAKKAAATVAKAKKAGRKATKKGVRYSDDFKNQVVDFVKSYNESKGRGGQNQAASKFKLSVLTVSAWLKAAGVKNPKSKPVAKKGVTVKKAAVKAVKAVKQAKSGKLSELEALKAAIRKLVG